MTPELTAKLLKRFPLMYRGYYSPMNQTCMCWGFEVGNGWEAILWQLSLAIEDELGYSWLQRKIYWLKFLASRSWNRMVYRLSPVGSQRLQGLKSLIWFPWCGFEVIQVKEKYATLRFYFSGGNERIEDLVDLAERASEQTCEDCGKQGRQRGFSWFYTACPEHSKDQDLDPEDWADEREIKRRGLPIVATEELDGPSK